MGKLRYKSIIPHNKPTWLLELQLVISQKYDDVEFENSAAEFERLYTFVHEVIYDMIYNGVIRRSVVNAEVRTDEGKTVLFICRNGKLLQTYYIQD